MPGIIGSNYVAPASFRMAMVLSIAFGTNDVTATNSGTFDPSAFASQIVVSEIMYHAANATAERVADPGESQGLSLANPLHIAIYLGLIGIAHLILILSGRRMDQVLLPALKPD